MNQDDWNQMKLKSFLNNIIPIEKCFKSINIRLMLVNEAEEWYIAQGLILLNPESSKKYGKEVILNSEKIKIIEIIIKPIKILKIIDQICKGNLKINKKTYLFSKDESKIDINSWVYERTRAHEKLGIESKTFILNLKVNDDKRKLPDNMHDFFENALKTNIIPFDGTNDLSKRFFLREDGQNILFDNKRIQIIGISLIGFDIGIGFKEGYFLLKLWADKNIKLKDLKITTLEQTDDLFYENRIISVNKKNVKDDKKDIFISIDKKVKNPDYQIISIKVFLSYRDQFIDVREFYNPFFKTYNYGIEIIKNYNEGIEFFLESLHGEKKEKAFELAIINLFSLFGFVSFPLDRIPGLQNFPDIILLDPYETRGIIVEITLGNITSDKKLDKLKRKYEDIKSSIPDINLVPLIITSKKIIGSNEQQLANEKEIAVFTFDDIDLTFEYAKQLASTGLIFEYIKNKIPVTKKDR